MLRTAPLLLVLAAASLGCVDITYNSREIRRTVLHVERTLTPVSVRTTIRQSGTLVEGEAVRVCAAYDVKQVERTVRSEPQHSSLAGELVALGFGAGLVGLGAGLTVDARHVYPSKMDGRLYNPIGPGAATGGGVTLIVTGALIMVAPVIDLVRIAAARPKEGVDVVKERGNPVMGGPVPCSENAVAANERVVGHVGTTLLELGVTGADGRLSVDLAKKVSAEWLHDLGDPARMQIWVGSGRAGDVELFPPGAAAAVAADEAPKARAPVQVAISPEDAVRAEGAVKSAHDACRRTCAAACSGKAGCAEACTAEACK